MILYIIGIKYIKKKIPCQEIVFIILKNLNCMGERMKLSRKETIKKRDNDY